MSDLEDCGDETEDADTKALRIEPEASESTSFGMNMGVIGGARLSDTMLFCDSYRRVGYFSSRDVTETR